MFVVKKDFFDSEIFLFNLSKEIEVAMTVVLSLQNSITMQYDSCLGKIKPPSEKVNSG